LSPVKIPAPHFSAFVSLKALSPDPIKLGLNNTRVKLSDAALKKIERNLRALNIDPYRVEAGRKTIPLTCRLKTQALTLERSEETSLKSVSIVKNRAKTSIQPIVSTIYKYIVDKHARVRRPRLSSSVT
jgi:hypothetical protein